MKEGGDLLLIRSQAWRGDRIDIAKLMLKKVNTTLTTMSKCSDPLLTEELSDLLFEIGKDLIAKAQWADAFFWLEAAYNKLAAQNPETLSSQAGDLKVYVMHSMVKCLTHQESEAGRRRAWTIVQELYNQYGDKLIVLQLKLDLLATEPTPKVEDYRATLCQIASFIHLTDSNVDNILHHIHKLKAWDAVMTHAVLHKFLKERLLGGDRQLWLEKTLITVVWSCATSEDFPEVLAALKNTLDIANDPKKAISVSVTHAAQVLLWKRIEVAYNQEKYDIAESWCRLSLHNIFRSSGSMNVGKLQRKLLLCFLGMSTAIKSLEVFATMSEATKSDPSTQYLLYKAALQLQDTDMAAQCLNNIHNSSTKNGSLLYACVLEAQRIGDEGQIITTLQRVVEKLNYSRTTGVHLPALLRCNAHLLMRSLDRLTDDAIDCLCKVFEVAATQAEQSRRRNDDSLFTIDELDWFSRNCYNLSLKVCHSWPPKQTLRVLQAALKLIDIYPADLEPAILADLSLRRLFCDFVLCSVCVHLARNEDDVESQLQHYLLVRHSVSDWRSHRPHQESRLEGGAQYDLALKYKTLLAYDFEAAARLNSWDDLSKIIAEYQDCKDIQVFAKLADIVLASEAPSAIVVNSLQQIINATWEIRTIDIAKLSRWIRCLIAKALNSDAGTAERTLHQAVNIVENTTKVDEEGAQYPAEELEWLATTIFNRAIDFYCSSQDAECRRWAEQALVLGRLCNDGGLLHGVLQDKFQSLDWQNR